MTPRRERSGGVAEMSPRLWFAACAVSLLLIDSARGAADSFPAADQGKADCRLMALADPAADFRGGGEGTTWRGVPT